MAYAPLTMIGGTVLQAAGLVAATAATTGVSVGHSDFTVYGAWTACETDSSNEIYYIAIEANTKAAPSTWVQIGVLAVLGHTTVLGAGTTAATGSVKAAFHNDYDNQVRINLYVKGTVATGINIAITAYPLQNLSYA